MAPPFLGKLAESPHSLTRTHWLEPSSLSLLFWSQQLGREKLGEQLQARLPFLGIHPILLLLDGLRKVAPKAAHLLIFSVSYECRDN